MILSLHIMSTEFHLRSRDRTQIFNILFGGYLRCYGFQNGVDEAFLAQFLRHEGYSPRETSMLERSRRGPATQLEVRQRAMLVSCIREEALRMDAVRRI